MQVIIMRGLPGSGKSSWIENYWATKAPKGIQQTICSADHYHMVNGVYQYDPIKAGEAHDKCLCRYLDALQRDLFPHAIFVDNTNTAGWEVAPYYRLGELFTTEVKIIRCHVDFETACKRNIHKAPESRIWQMYQNLMEERLPAWWKEEIVFGV